jgi:hypothetical protein
MKPSQNLTETKPLNKVMENKSLNRNLHAAKATRQDDFYTQRSDIDKELKHYKKHFKNKTVLCNCDDPRVSNFFNYFVGNFQQLGLKRLIATSYQNDKPDIFSQYKSDQGIYFIYSGEQNNKRLPDPKGIKPCQLKGDGDFRSQECVELLKQADIVVTNPPFSLFREYVAQLIKYEKKFLIIGNTNSLTYKDTFRLIMQDKIRTGYTNFNVGMFFVVPDDWKHFHHVDKDGKKIARVATSCWFTNLDVAKHKEFLPLYKEYTPEEYPRYDNYDAIEVSRYKDIPADYDGVMGVPITFLDKYNPEQFEIIGITDRGNAWGLKTKEYTSDDVGNPGDLNRRAAIKIGKTYKPTYARLLIRRKL